MVFLCRYTN